jgi:hypothetical protein
MLELRSRSRKTGGIALSQKVGNRPDYGAFIPKQLDDYGLNPFEFRVFCHISRRAGTQEGEFYESDLKASKLCRMELKTYRKAKHFLEQVGMITIENRPGKTGVVHLMHHDNWVSGEPLTATKSGGTKSGTATKSGGTKSGGTKSGGTKSGTATKSGGTKSGATPLPNQVLPNQAHKGTPISSEGSSLKVLNPPISPQRGDGGIANAFQSEDPIATEPKLSEQNTTSDRNSSAVKGQSSAPRRRLSKKERNLREAYPDAPPPWRYGYGINEYHEGFIAIAKKTHEKLPETSIYKTAYTPIGLIALREAKGDWEELHARCDEYQAAVAQRQATAAQTIAQPEPPREPLEEAIARIMTEQGLTPADVLPQIVPKYKLVFLKLPSDPEEAWDCLSQGQLAIVRSFLEKNYAPTP